MAEHQVIDIDINNYNDNDNDNENYYSFFYCDLHDDGAVIKGNIKYVNDNVKICPGGNCCTIDYGNCGIIKYDGNNYMIYEEVKKLRTNFDRYGGGYEFEYFTGNIMDQSGNELNKNENEKLTKLIEHISNKLNKNNIYDL